MHRLLTQKADITILAVDAGRFLLRFKRWSRSSSPVLARTYLTRSRTRSSRFDQRFASLDQCHDLRQFGHEPCQCRLPDGTLEMHTGLIQAPAVDEMVWAEKGTDAFMNDRRLRVSARREMSDSVFATGIPFAAMSIGRRSAFAQTLAALMPQVADVRRFGATGTIVAGKPHLQAKLRTAVTDCMQPGGLTPLPRAPIQQLAKAAFMQTVQNLILAGGTATGKTHRADALGATAIQQGERVHVCTAGANVHYPRSAASPDASRSPAQRL